MAFFRNCEVMNVIKAPMEGTNWVDRTWNCSHCKLDVSYGLVVWYGHLLATFGGFSSSKQCCMVSRAPSHPPLPPTRPPPCSAVLKLMHTLKNRLKQPKIQPSAIYKVSYMKANRLLCLLLILKPASYKL